MLQFNLRIFGSQSVHNLTPEAGRFQYIRFVDAGQFFAAFAGNFKGLAHNALHFRYVIYARIYRFFALLALAAQLLSEIDTAGQLTYNHQVSAFQYFRF
ncbi:hypothetical protein D3C86_1799440 [compost metagenome]